MHRFGTGWIEYSSRSLASNGVADAAQGSDQSLIVITNFISKVPDIDIDDVRCSLESLVPNVSEDHAPRQNAIGVCHQVFQKGVFLCSQLDIPSAFANLLREPVQFQVINPEDVFSAPGASP